MIVTSPAGPATSKGASTDKPDFSAVRDVLLKEQKQALMRIQSVNIGPDSLAVDADGVPLTDQVRDSALSAMLGNRLAEIDDALHRLDAGTYGHCQTCGNSIPPRRLEALPFAVYCVACQAQADKRRQAASRVSHQIV